MKWLFWLLLLVSLLFFALIQWGEMLTGDSKNTQVQQALNPEKIVLLKTLPVLTAPASSPSVAPLPAPPACMEWGEFSGNDLARATAALDTLKLGDKLAQRQVEHASGYWVYIPPRADRAEADKKIAQLNALGVKDHFVVQDAGKWRNAISLGVFKTEDAAHKFLESIKGKGVKSAIAGERMSKLSFTVFVLKNLDAETSARMEGLRKDFAGSELRKTACD